MVHPGGPEGGRAVAADPATPRSVVEGLLREAVEWAEGPRRALAEAVLGNASLPLWLLDDPTWMQRLHDRVASALACSPRLAAWQWDALCGHRDVCVRLELAISPVAPPDAWSRLGLGPGLFLDSLLLDHDWLIDLLSSGVLGQVTHLGLGDNDLGDDVITALADSPSLRQLEGLVVSHNRFSDAGVVALVDSPHLRGLRRLWLGPNLALGDAGAIALSRASFHLEELDLSITRMTSRGLEALAQSASFEQLTDLSLFANDGRDAGAIALAGSTAFPRLERLSLSENKLGDAGVIALVRSTAFPRLVSLDLRNNRAGPPSALALAASPVLASLTHLDLRLNPLGRAGKWALRKAAARHPGLTLLL